MPGSVMIILRLGWMKLFRLYSSSIKLVTLSIFRPEIVTLP